MAISVFTKKIDFDFGSNNLDALKLKVQKTFENMKISKLDFEGMDNAKNMTSDKMNQGLTEEEKQIIQNNLALKEKLANTEQMLQELESVGLKGSQRYNELLKEKNNLEKDLNKNSLSFKDKLKNGLKGMGNAVKQFSLNKLTQGLQMVGDFFLNIIRDALKEMKEMQSYNSSGAGYSQDAWEQQMKYGFNDAENFAFKKALSKANMTEETYEIGGLNEAQWNKFQEYFNLYQQEYESNQAHLQEQQELNDKWEEIQEKLKATVIRFLAENSDTIIAALQGMFSILEGLFKVVGWIFDTMGDGSQTEYEANKNIDNLITQNSISSTSNVNNININNQMNSTAPGVTNVHQLKQTTQNNYAQISNAISLK